MVKQSITCKILRFHNNPTDEAGKELPGVNVEIECTIGDRRWTILRYLNYKRPISMEEFIIELEKTKIIPDEPKDFFAYIKEEVGKPFEITVDRNNKKNNGV